MKLCQRLWLSNKLTYILSILLWKTTQAQAQAHKFKTRNLCIHQRGLLVCVRMRAQAHIYIYTHISALAPRIRTDIHRSAHTQVYRCVHSHTYTDVHMHTRMGVLTPHKHTQVRSRACIHRGAASTGTRMHKGAHKGAHMDEHAPTNVLTCSLTHVLEHTHTCSNAH